MKYFDIMNQSSNNEGLQFSEKKYEQFMKYKDLIKEWNEKVNLTAIKEDEEIVKKHFIDSIKVFKFKELKNAKNIIDIGTGGGFPGIPMKIIKPEINIVLLDSLNKRINFLNIVIQELQLERIKAIHGRAEDFGKDINYREQFDLCVSRAVAKLSSLSEYCLPYVKVGGYFISYKSGKVQEELDMSVNAFQILGAELKEVSEFMLPNTDIERTLVVLQKKATTPNKYPRSAGKPSKDPL